MSSFRVFMLFALTCISTSSSMPVQAKSGSSMQSENSLNESVFDYPVTVPLQVLRKLLDISDKSKGLRSLWINSKHLTHPSILEDEYKQQKYRVCRGQPIFYDNKKCKNFIAHSSLNRSQLVNYYNELVIHLRIAESLVELNTSIFREIKQVHRNKVETRQRTVIGLLREEILPLINVVLNATGDQVDCNTTETIANKKISLYTQYCPSIQTANIFLSQTTSELYRVLNATHTAHRNNNEDQTSQYNDMIMNDHYDTKVWCIV